ncbi:MAG: FHA domain-containing protein [Pseudomonadota bacterium]|nr:FHA domain-containing protein [Pseudomonadota bacterium]
MSESAIVVELLDRTGSVTARHRCNELPVRLGRAYDNDVVVDDPFVAATHVRIERRADGALMARDEGTRNGIHAATRGRRTLWQRVGERSTEIVLTPNTLVRAGHSTFRVRPIDHAVAPERLDTTAHAWEGLRPALVAFLILGLLAMFNAWRSNTTTQENFVYETNVALVLGTMVVWAGAWALLNRLFGGRARFGRHFLIGTIFLVASIATDLAAELLAYAFSLDWLSRFGSYLGLGLLSIAVYFHVATITPLSLSFARRFAVAFAVLAIGLFGMYRYSTEHQFGDSLYMGSLQWPAIRVVPPISTEAFVKATDDLKARADLRRNDNAGGEEY